MGARSIASRRGVLCAPLAQDGTVTDGPVGP